MTNATHRVAVSHLNHLPADQVARALVNPAFGMAEKVNGQRRTVEVLPTSEMLAYNRGGKERVVPTAALALAKIGVPCLVDGEDMMDGTAYVMFDLLELDGESVRDEPFATRIALLEELTRGLVGGGPTLATNTTITHGLALLVPTINSDLKAELFDQLRAAGAEGVVFRTMQGRSRSGNARGDEVKVKFESEVDCFVIGRKSGVAGSGGSLLVGVVRESDGAIIEIGSVRSGFNDAAIDRVMARVEADERPVLKVSFLTARTVGYRLVEPKAWPAGLRDDKTWQECSSSQLIELLGEDRRAKIDAAPNTASDARLS